MAAVSAITHNPDLKAFYTRLRAKGKEAKLALTAVMRKLIILASALIRENRTWTGNMLDLKHRCSPYGRGDAIATAKLSPPQLPKLFSRNPIGLRRRDTVKNNHA